MQACSEGLSYSLVVMCSSYHGVSTTPLSELGDEKAVLDAAGAKELKGCTLKKEGSNDRRREGRKPV